MRERFRRVFKDASVLVMLLVTVAAWDIHEPWLAGALFAALGLICWPQAKRFEGRSWLRRTDGRIHALDYFGLIAMLALLTAGLVQAFDSLDLECWVRTGHLLGPTCNTPPSH